MTRLVLQLAILGACGLIACEDPPYQPKVHYPYAGFGRSGCYAGATLLYVDGSDVGRQTKATPVNGPWLVLDSVPIRRSLWRRFLWRRRVEQPAFVVERRDSIEARIGRWFRVAPDSIVVVEGFNVTNELRLRLAGDELRGVGMMHHDVVTIGTEGDEERMVSRWPVWLARVPCAAVPLIRRP